MAAVRGLRAPDLDALAGPKRRRARRRIERAHLSIDGQRPMRSSRCRLRCFWIFDAYVAPSAGCGIGAAGHARGEAGADRQQASTRRRPRACARACRPSRARRSGTRTTSSIGPVSSPASICISVIPVSSSPARRARWIGAAPRQRGRSEACTLMHPCRGQARIAAGRMSPYAATTSTSRSRAEKRRPRLVARERRRLMDGNRALLRELLHRRGGELLASSARTVGLGEHQRRPEISASTSARRRMRRERRRAGETDLH